MYSTENHLSRNKMLYVADNHNYMCHICAIEFLDSNFNQAVIENIYQFFIKWPQISHTHKNPNFKSIIGN